MLKQKIARRLEWLETRSAAKVARIDQERVVHFVNMDRKVVNTLTWKAVQPNVWAHFDPSTGYKGGTCDDPRVLAKFRGWPLSCCQDLIQIRPRREAKNDPYSPSPGAAGSACVAKGHRPEPHLASFLHNVSHIRPGVSHEAIAIRHFYFRQSAGIHCLIVADDAVDVQNVSNHRVYFRGLQRSGPIKRPPRELRARFGKMPTSELQDTYRQMHGLAVLPTDILMPAKPWVLQTLMQAYRELYRRYPKGR